MLTGACGINCDTCRLCRRGLCNSCGSGTSKQARLKIEAQERLLGAACPILACAGLNRLEFCMADCDQFPCENFSADDHHGYPYSEGFIDMQKRRRVELEESQQQDDQFSIPNQHWLEISNRSVEDIVQCSGARLSDDGSLLLDVLNQTLRINTGKKKIDQLQESGWIAAPALLAFVTAVYLTNAKLSPLTGRWVSEKGLLCREFFRGPHTLRTESVLNRFGEAAADFIKAAERVGGVTTNDSGDGAIRLWVFPTIPVKLILWCGDDELPAAVTVLFDHSINELLPGDGIWAMVQLICETLVEQAPQVS